MAASAAASQDRPRRRLYTQLWFWVVIAIGAGIAFGFAAPAAAKEAKWLADAFLQVIKAVTGPVIFVTVVDLPALAVLGFWFLGQLVSFYGEARLNMSGGVAFLAHIGGFVAGAIAMPVLNRMVPHPQPQQSKTEEQDLDERWPLDRW